MKAIIALVCLATGCAATFFSQSQASPKEPEAYNLCVYSKDPGQYKPNCFLCPTKVYTNALEACVNGTTMPSNITYASAKCMEENCAINYPKPEASESLSTNNFLETLSKLLRMSRSVSDNVVEDASDTMILHPSSDRSPKLLNGRRSNWKVVGHYKTFASDMDIEMDYTT